MREKQRYGYVKSLVYTEFANVACSLGSNSFNYTFNLEGVLNPPWYIVGVQWEPFIWDQNLAVIDKIFNYEDPLIANNMQIQLQSTNQVMGDDMRTTVTGGTWLRFKTQFQPGRLYDMSEFPIVVHETTVYLAFSMFFDTSLVVTQLNCLQNLTLHIGSDMPERMRP